MTNRRAHERGVSPALAKKLLLSVFIMIVTYAIAHSIIQPRQGWGAMRQGAVDVERVAMELALLGTAALIAMSAVWFFTIKRVHSLLDRLSGTR